MADGHAALDAQIRRLRELGSLVPKAAPAIAQAVKGELDAQVAAGTGPDGTPWQPTKAGGRPLQGAADAVSVRAVGTVIVASVDGHHALHHRGWVRGGVRRPILPTSKIPDPVTRAIAKTVTTEFRRTMGAR